MLRWLRDRKRRRARALVAIDRQQFAWIEQVGSGAQALASCDHGESGAVMVREAMRRVKDMRPAVRTIDVIVGNDVALHWVQTPPASLASFVELRQIAQVRCAHLHGGSPEDWWVTGDWHASRLFVCAALPRAMVSTWEQQFAQCQLVPRWHTTWGIASAGLASAFPIDGWSAMRSPARLVLWHCRKGRIDCMASLATDGREEPVQLTVKARQQILVENSRTDHTAGDVVHWIDLVAGSRIPTLDAATTGIAAVQLPPVVSPWASIPLTEAAAALVLQPLLEGHRV